MKNGTRYHALTLLALLCILACKKNKISKVDGPGPKKPLEIKRLVPVKFESAGLTLHLKYKDNTALLTEINEGGGNKIVIDYTTESYPAKLEKYKNGRLFYIVYYVLDNNKKVGKAVTFDYDDLSYNYTPTGFYALGYNNLELLYTIDHYNHTNNPENTCTLSYISSGSLSEMRLNNNQGPVNMMTYTFDQKKGTSSLIPYSQLFTLEADHWFLLCSSNNILSCLNQKSPLENINVTYEYNEDGYPSTVSISKNKHIQIIKITYKTLEQ